MGGRDVREGTSENKWKLSLGFLVADGVDGITDGRWAWETCHRVVPSS